MGKNRFLIIGVTLLVLLTIGVFFILIRETSTLPSKGASDKTQEPSDKDTVLQSNNIKIQSPKLNEEVGLPIIIKGEARVFENVVSIRLKEKSGKVLVEDIAMAQSPDTGQFGPFQVSLNFPKPESSEGIVEVFQSSAKDGSEIDKVTIPVKFKKVESQIVKVFFSKDDRMEDCSIVFPFERRVPETEAIARESLEELLEGPTLDEKRKGHFTNINEGVKIQKLTISEGVARVDFSSELEQEVAGACRVTAIRSQITQTLKQFPTAKQVVISVNGRETDIMQP